MENQIAEFDGLTVKQYAEKLKGVTDLSLLSQLEEKEKEGESRKGVISAINEKQGELLDNQINEDPESSEDIEVKEEGDKEEEGTMEETPVKESDASEDLVGYSEQEVFKSQEQYKQGAIDTVRDLRLELDRIGKFGERHVRISDKFETPVFLAKAWLGKLLGYMGEANPYQVEGGIQNEKQIPPTAEVDHSMDFELKLRDFANKNSIPAIEHLRERLDKVAYIINDIDPIELDLGERSRVAHICRTNAWSNVLEARFFLEDDLSKIRK